MEIEGAQSKMPFGGDLSSKGAEDARGSKQSAWIPGTMKAAETRSIVNESPNSFTSDACTRVLKEMNASRDWALEQGQDDDSVDSELKQAAKNETKGSPTSVEDLDSRLRKVKIDEDDVSTRLVDQLVKNVTANPGSLEVLPMLTVEMLIGLGGDENKNEIPPRNEADTTQELRADKEKAGAADAAEDRRKRQRDLFARIDQLELKNQALRASNHDLEQEKEESSNQMKLLREQIDKDRLESEKFKAMYEKIRKKHTEDTEALIPIIRMMTNNGRIIFPWED